MNLTEINKIFIPLLVASLAFIAKLIIELALEIRKKNITQLEERLKFFYWPLLIRIEKDNAIWPLILAGRDDADSIQYKIAKNVVQEVLQNHLEALKIIEESIHLADPDTELVEVINQYIKNVTVYKAIREAGDSTTFPLKFNAPWPVNLYAVLSQKTELYQRRLNTLIGIKNPKHILNLFKNYSRKPQAKNGAIKTLPITQQV